MFGSSFELKDAIRFVGLIVAIVVTMLVGDYLGYKIGRWKLALILAVLTLVTVVAFTIYSAIRLA